MGLYSAYQTDPNLERIGIVFDTGDARIRLARSGGSNKRFSKLMEKKSQPYRQAMKLDQLDDAIAEQVLIEVYADAVVLGWETLVEGEWKSGIEGPEGVLLPFNYKNVVDTLKALPDLFRDIQELASKHSNFRHLEREEASKNS